MEQAYMDRNEGRYRDNVRRMLRQRAVWTDAKGPNGGYVTKEDVCVDLPGMESVTYDLLLFTRFNDDPSRQECGTCRWWTDAERGDGWYKICGNSGSECAGEGKHWTDRCDGWETQYHGAACGKFTAYKWIDAEGDPDEGFIDRLLSMETVADRTYLAMAPWPYDAILRRRRDFPYALRSSGKGLLVADRTYIAEGDVRLDGNPNSLILREKVCAPCVKRPEYADVAELLFLMTQA